MASNILTYSPADVKIILCGYTLTGIVSVTLQWKGAKPFKVIRGLKGQHTRVFNPDLYATVCVEVLQTSITNDIFTSILVQDRRVQAGRLEFSVNDKSGSTFYQSTDCFLGEYPDIALHGDLETYKWNIECPTFIDGGVGGNARQGFDLFDSANGAIDYISGKGSEFIDSATSFIS